MGVKAVSDPHEFQTILSTAGDKLVVVDFTATWCGPCQTIAPVYASLAEKYPNVHFLKVDVDQSQPIAAAAGVSAMPTFQFFKHLKKVDELKGANASALENLIKKHAVADSNGGQSSSGVPGQANISSEVALNQLSCLNEQQDHGIRSIFGPNAKGFLESDVDEQLMISVQFNQAVKIHSIKLTAPVDQGPKTVKIYANLLALGFDEAEGVQETQTLTLTEKDVAADAIIPLRFVKFQNVSSLIIFVVDNLGGTETTRINKLDFIGSVIEGSDRTKVVQKVDGGHD